MRYPDSVTPGTIKAVDTLIIENQFAKAEISLFGGHVLSFTPKKDHRNRLWLSKNAVFDQQTPIRGGIPICWPWFSNDHEQNDLNLPSHGFLRTQNWNLVACEETQTGTLLQLKPSSINAYFFNFKVDILLEIRVGDSLEVKLTTHNKDTSDFKFNCAFHSYFSVADILQAELKGIEGKYLDKLLDGKILQTPAPYLFDDETDRIHLCQAQVVEIIEPLTTTSITSDGHDSLVVWNPWLEKSHKINDMVEDGYSTMLCVETASTQWTHLQPGESHTLVQIIS